MTRTVFTKTADGHDELRSRTRKLSAVLRHLLILVNGERSTAELRSMLGTRSSIDSGLNMLAAAGLIECILEGAVISEIFPAETGEKRLSKPLINNHGVVGTWLVDA